MANSCCLHSNIKSVDEVVFKEMRIKTQATPKAVVFTFFLAKGTHCKSSFCCSRFLIFLLKMQLMWTAHPDVNRWGNTSLWCWKKNQTLTTQKAEMLWFDGAQQTKAAGSSLALTHCSAPLSLRKTLWNFTTEKIWKCFPLLFMTICRVTHPFFIKALIAK